MAILAEVGRGVGLAADVRGGAVRFAAAAVAVSIAAGVVQAASGASAATLRPVAIAEGIRPAIMGALGPLAQPAGMLSRGAGFLLEVPPIVGRWGALAPQIEGDALMRSGNALAQALAAVRGTVPFESMLTVGPAVGLPPAWAAWALPVGGYIGANLAALAIARGEDWHWDADASKLIVAGKILITIAGLDYFVQSPEWADRWITAAVRDLAEPIGMSAVVAGDERSHWMSGRREADAARARRLLATAGRGALDAGRRSALEAEAGFLILRT